MPPGSFATSENVQRLRTLELHDQPGHPFQYQGACSHYDNVKFEFRCFLGMYRFGARSLHRILIVKHLEQFV